MRYLRGRNSNSGMLRKFFYSLIAISFVIIVNQISGGSGTAATGTDETVPTGSGVAAGVVEVRVSASQANADITSAKINISSVEVHVPEGWAKMEMENTTVDLKRVEGLEETIATTSLDQGTYTQIRVKIDSVEVTLGDGEPKKASLSTSLVSFTQNFQVTNKAATVLLLNFNAAKSIEYNSKGQITFNPLVDLLFTRTPGSMELITSELASGEAGLPYLAKLMAFGGQHPYDWSVPMGDMPPGLTLDTITGEISGIPTAAGIFNFLIKVEDASPNRKSTSRNYMIGISVQGN